MVGAMAAFRRGLSILLVSVCACSARRPAEPAQAPETVDTAGDESAESASDLDLTRGSAEASSEVERIFRLSAPDDAPSQGPLTAKVTVEVCSDFECPFCARLVPTLHQIVENYGELVRVAWRDCPLPFHEHALLAAEAAREVYRQAGNDGFWEYHDALFAQQDRLGIDALVERAGALSAVNAEEVRAALADHRHVEGIRGQLRGLVDSGAASGGFGTPATFVNGRLISGAQPYEVFEDAIERALQESPEDRATAEQVSEAAYPMARVRHVLVQYEGARGAGERVTRSKEQAHKRAEKLRRRIVADGIEMADVAREQSDCPSASEGGELGKFTRGELVPEFESALFALEPGQVSEVVETPFGFHIILREE